MVFQIIAEREHGSLVATHEPSPLESTQEVTLCTFDEITEIWFDDKDINQALILVQPKKSIDPENVEPTSQLLSIFQCVCHFA